MGTNSSQSSQSQGEGYVESWSLQEEQEFQREIEPADPDLQTKEKLAQLKDLNRAIFSKPLTCKSHYECLAVPVSQDAGLFDLYLHQDSTFDLIGLRIIESNNDLQEQQFHFIGVYTIENKRFNFWTGLQAAYIKQTQSIPTQ